MNKNLVTCLQLLKQRCKKVIFFTNLTIVFLLFFTIHLFANDANAQIPISLNIQNAPLNKVFQEVEKTSPYRFVFNDDIIPKGKVVSITVVNVELSALLKKVLVDTDLTFRSPSEFVVVISKIINLENIVVKGKITNEKGEALVGATIAEDKSSNKVVSDKNGQYTIELTKAGSISISFEGYETGQYVVTKSSTLNVVLEPNIKALDDVVVVGYGTVKKSDLTGSVSKIKMENAAQQASSSFEQLLQGKTSGVNITQSSGDPGSGILFNIRGTNSLNENQPLIVIDGYPVESDNGSTYAKTGAEYWTSEQKPGNALANLNPNDIESVEILKDASSTAIYGSRGANGVVMITTKRGKEGKDKVTYNYRMDISNIPRKIDVLDSWDFTTYANEASKNSGQPMAFDSTSLANLKSSNWQDLIYETSYSKDHQVTLSGGDFKTKYAIAANYTDVNGVVRYTNFTKQGISVNLDRQFSNKVKVGISSKINFSQHNAGYQSTNHAFIGGSVIGGALRWSPTSTLLDEDGDLIISAGNQSNPLVTLERSSNLTKSTMALTNAFAEYTIVKNLKFRANGGFNMNSAEYKSYWGRGTQIGDGNNGQAYQSQNNNINYLAEYTLNYSGIISKKHKISALSGYTTQNWRAGSNGIVVRGFPNDNLRANALQFGSTIGTPTSTYKEWALASYIGRVNYGYDNRYLLTLTGRADGSSRLAPNNKWDFFPSVAMGWNLHKERFFKKNSVLTEAKLKASYGISGNQNISIGATQALFGISRAANTFGSVLSGVSLSSFDNPNLHWEKTYQYNAGLELSFFKNRFLFSVDYYQKRTKDLLINMAIPSDNGFLSYNTNLGEIENAGLEIESEVKLFTKTFKWSVNGNISFNSNKVVDLGQNKMILGRNLIPTGLDQIGTVAMPGYNVGAFYGYKVLGIYQNAAEIAAGPVDPINPQPGDFKYADINKDGRITTDDRSIIGNPTPKYIFGLSNTFSYKKFDLSIFVMGKIKYAVLNLNRFYSDGLVYSASGNLRKEAFDNRWRGEGTSNYYPRAKRTGSLFDKRISDFLVEDGSFIRLKNINFSYNLDVKKLKYISNLKVFANVSNLFTITKYKGYDPEVSGLGLTSLNQNIDLGTIPLYRSYSFGVNVGF